MSVLPSAPMAPDAEMGLPEDFPAAGQSARDRVFDQKTVIRYALVDNADVYQRIMRWRRLWGNGKGRFVTKGRYASATVRGTIWLTEDRCTSTLVRVRAGRIEVFDRVLRRRITVRAGQSYVARAR